MTKLSSILTAGGLAAAIGFSTMQPAKADTTSTVETILGAAAVVAGVAIETNIAHKNALANRIVGYTPSGATVYADGHVVLPNGQSYYPGNNNQTIACNGQACTISGQGQYGYAPSYGNGYYGNTGYNNGYNNGGYNTGYNNGYGYPSSRTVRINRPYAGSAVATRNAIAQRNIAIRNEATTRSTNANGRPIHVTRSNSDRR
ncbi:MAG: hypothetical protein ABI346_05925 [Candidatus Baltobacteraceae bacterium]